MENQEEIEQLKAELLKLKEEKAAQPTDTTKVLATLERAHATSDIESLEHRDLYLRTAGEFSPFEFMGSPAFGGKVSEFASGTKTAEFKTENATVKIYAGQEYEKMLSLKPGQMKVVIIKTIPVHNSLYRKTEQTQEELTLPVPTHPDETYALLRKLNVPIRLSAAERANLEFSYIQSKTRK